MRTFLSQLKGCCPNLEEVTVANEVINNCSVMPFMEGLFAHFFSPYRRDYHTKDVQWFLELANEQKQWTANPWELKRAQQQPHVHDQPAKVGHLSVVINPYL